LKEKIVELLNQLHLLGNQLLLFSYLSKMKEKL